MGLYISQGRLLDFVTDLMLAEQKEKREKEEQHDDDRLFNAYIHSMPDKSFSEWKKDLQAKAVEETVRQVKKFDVNEQVNKSRSILNKVKM